MSLVLLKTSVMSRAIRETGKKYSTRVLVYVYYFVII